MKKNPELILKLEELVLTRKKYSVMCQDPADLEEIEARIIKIRRQVPSALLSQFDELAKQFADVVAVVQDQICQGCHERISHRLAVQVEQQACVFCEHCGRFLISDHAAPKYVE